MRKLLMITVAFVGVSALAPGAIACGAAKTADRGGSGDSVASAPMSTPSRETQTAGGGSK